MKRHLANSLQPRPTRWSAARCCAQVAIVLLLTVALQEVSEASCGDYVFIRDAKGRLVPASELSGKPGMPAAHAAAPLGKPCNGPACSQRRNLPPATPPAPIVWPSSPEALLASLLGGPDRPQSDSPRPMLATAHPIHHPGRVFRPPRLPLCA